MSDHRDAAGGFETAGAMGATSGEAGAAARAHDPHAEQPLTTLSPIFTDVPARSPQTPAAPAVRDRAAVEITIDGHPVTVPAGATILEACRAQEIDIPTLCQVDTLDPAGVCRLCVVDTGGRALTPSCSARVSQGMDVRTDSEKVRHSRKLVLELIASAVELDIAGPVLPDGGVASYIAEYGADPGRFGPPAPRTGPDERDGRHAGHHHATDGQAAATVGQPVKVDNDLYVRDYARCILCYKCVDACGVGAQNTFAISVAGRGFDARISTEWNVPLPESACVYCGNCIAVCPTGALMFRSEHDMRQAGTWDESKQTTTDTICPYCGVGCTLSLTVQDDRIVRVLSPLDSGVTEGNLCVKGRFGFEFVQSRPPKRTKE
jgi:predicted molibdopterin-dependent oxidoreductase YjgC